MNMFDCCDDVMMQRVDAMNITTKIFQNMENSAIELRIYQGILVLSFRVKRRALFYEMDTFRLRVQNNGHTNALRKFFSYNAHTF